MIDSLVQVDSTAMAESTKMSVHTLIFCVMHDGRNSSKLRGMCGNMDGAANNDLTNGCGQDVAGLQEDSGKAMGSSWQEADDTHDLEE